MSAPAAADGWVLCTHSARLLLPIAVQSHPHRVVYACNSVRLATPAPARLRHPSGAIKAPLGGLAVRRVPGFHPHQLWPAGLGRMGSRVGRRLLLEQRRQKDAGCVRCRAGTALCSPVCNTLHASLGCILPAFDPNPLLQSPSGSFTWPACPPVLCSHHLLWRTGSPGGPAVSGRLASGLSVLRWGVCCHATPLVNPLCGQRGGLAAHPGLPPN